MTCFQGQQYRFAQTCTSLLTPGTSCSLSRKSPAGFTKNRLLASHQSGGITQFLTTFAAFFRCIPDQSWLLSGSTLGTERFSQTFLWSHFLALKTHSLSFPLSHRRFLLRPNTVSPGSGLPLCGGVSCFSILHATPHIPDHMDYKESWSLVEAIKTPGIKSCCWSSL